MENEDVAGAAPTGDAPTTSEWSTILLPTKVRLILETWRYVMVIKPCKSKLLWPNYWTFQEIVTQFERCGVLSWPGADRFQLYISISGRTSYRKFSWSLEAARFGFRLFQSLWNLTGTSAATLSRCLSNSRAIRSLWIQSRGFDTLRDLAVRRG